MKIKKRQQPVDLQSLDGEGASVILEAGAGIASAAEDASGLAGAIRKLRDSPPHVLEAMGKSGRAYYENHFEPRFLARNLKEALLATKARY